MYGSDLLTNDLEISSDGKTLIGNRDKILKLINVENGELIKVIEFDNYIRCMKLINDEMIIIVTINNEFENNILVYDLKNEKILRNSVLSGYKMVI